MSGWNWEILAVMGVAALPVFELRGAIPLALAYGLDPLGAYAVAVLGNLLPVPFLLAGLGRLLREAHRLPPLDRGLTWWAERTRRGQSAWFNRLGALALVAFVALPLPVTGAWTGSLAAVLFAVPPRYALPLIALGVLIAGVVVTLASLGVIHLFGIGG